MFFENMFFLDTTPDAARKRHTYKRREKDGFDKKILFEQKIRLNSIQEVVRSDPGRRIQSRVTWLHIVVKKSIVDDSCGIETLSNRTRRVRTNGCSLDKFLTREFRRL